MTIPTVHMNGTSKADLIDGYCKARSAVLDAASILRANVPNARDYHLQGPRAFESAIEEYADRIDRLQQVYNELTDLIDAIDRQEE